jgi:uncharacterized protein YoxC
MEKDIKDIKKTLKEHSKVLKEHGRKLDKHDDNFEKLLKQNYLLQQSIDKRFEKQDEKLDSIITSVEFFFFFSKKLSDENSAGAYNQRQITDTIVDHETRIAKLELAS